MRQSESKKIVIFLLCVLFVIEKNALLAYSETENHFENLIQKGNRLFDEGALQEALGQYDEALDLLEVTQPTIPFEWKKTLITRMAYTELFLGHEDRFLDIF